MGVKKGSKRVSIKCLDDTGKLTTLSFTMVLKDTINGGLESVDVPSGESYPDNINARNRPSFVQHFKELDWQSFMPQTAIKKVDPEQNGRCSKV